ncbi:MAG: hypothetical protein COB46_13025 [Rhodospirillaceae bacterium]|nr:MAG: hypothetical protein COB46_13025 [Rhodospirillaceae bacterium]
MNFLNWKSSIPLVVISTCLMVGAILYSFQLGKSMSERYAPLVEAALEIKVEATTAHLWFEEMITGDTTLHPKDIWKHIDQAKWYAEAMLKGGKNHKGTFFAVKNKDVREQVEQTIKGLDDFRTAAEERWALRSESKPGSAIDQRFDAIFDRFLSSANAAEIALKMTNAEQLKRFSIIESVMIAVLVMLGIFTVVLIQKNTQVLNERAEELQRALDSEIEYITLQKQFVSMASHEFRTPLSIIDMTVQRLLKRHTTMTEEKINERYATILHSVTRITGLIESILNAEQNEEGRLIFSGEPCDVQDIIKKCVQSQTELAPDYTITQDLRGLPDIMIANPVQLSQIFANLLSNAVKFSPECKTIDVRAWTEDSYVYMSVMDYGIGIRDDEKPKVFNRFFRTSNAAGIPGTGISLNLVQQLAQLHGGDIYFESVDGEGSTFTVTLRTEPQPS